MQVYGEGNGPLGTAAGFGTFEIFGGPQGFGGAWSNEPIPDARALVAFTDAERNTQGTGLIASALNGLGDVFGFGDLGDLILGDSDAPYGAADFGKVDPAVVTRIEKLKARKHHLKELKRHASGQKRDKIEAEIKEINHLLKLARNLRASQRAGWKKAASLALGPAGLIATRGGAFRSRKKQALKEAAARKEYERQHKISSRTMKPHKLPPWAVLARRRALAARQRRFVPPGYPPVPGYNPYPSPQPGVVPGTYMVPGGNLPPMPAGGPGYMNQAFQQNADGAPGAEGAGPDADGDEGGGGGLWKIGLGVLVVGGVVYAVTQGRKGRGPKLSKAERRARRAGMGGPP